VEEGRPVRAVGFYVARRLGAEDGEGLQVEDERNMRFLNSLIESKLETLAPSNYA
jgi:hypothetical protein